MLKFGRFKRSVVTLFKASRGAVLTPQAVNLQRLDTSFDVYKASLESFANQQNFAPEAVNSLVREIPDALIDNEVAVVEILNHSATQNLVVLFDLISYHKCALKSKESVDTLLNCVCLILCKRPILLENGQLATECFKRLLQCLVRVGLHASPQVEYMIEHVNKVARKNIDDLIEHGELCRVYRRLNKVLNPKNVDALVHAIWYKLPHFTQADVGRLPSLLLKIGIYNEKLLDKVVSHVAADLVGALGSLKLALEFRKGLQALDNVTPFNSGQVPSATQSFIKHLNESLPKANEAHLCLALALLGSSKWPLAQEKNIKQLTMGILSALKIDNVDTNRRKCQTTVRKLSQQSFLDLVVWLASVKRLPLTSVGKFLQTAASKDNEEAEVKLEDLIDLQHKSLHLLVQEELERRLKTCKGAVDADNGSSGGGGTTSSEGVTADYVAIESSPSALLNVNIFSFLNASVKIGINASICIKLINEALQHQSPTSEHASALLNSQLFDTMYTFIPEIKLELLPAIVKCASRMLMANGNCILAECLPLVVNASKLCGDGGFKAFYKTLGLFDDDSKILQSLTASLEKMDPILALPKTLMLWHFLRSQNYGDTKTLENRIKDLLKLLASDYKVVHACDLNLMLQVPLDEIIGKVPAESPLKILLWQLLASFKNITSSSPSENTKEQLQALNEYAKHTCEALDRLDGLVSSVFSRRWYPNTQGQYCNVWDSHVPIKHLLRPPKEPLDIFLHERCREVANMFVLEPYALDGSGDENGATLYHVEMQLRNLIATATEYALETSCEGRQELQEAHRFFCKVLDRMAVTAALLGTHKPVFENLPMSRRHVAVRVDKCGEKLI